MGRPGTAVAYTTYEHSCTICNSGSMEKIFSFSNSQHFNKQALHMSLKEDFRLKNMSASYLSSHVQYIHFDALLVCSCRLLITFANRLDPNQTPQSVGSDLHPNC